MASAHFDSTRRLADHTWRMTAALTVAFPCVGIGIALSNLGVREPAFAALGLGVALALAVFMLVTWGGRRVTERVAALPRLGPRALKGILAALTVSVGAYFAAGAFATEAFASTLSVAAQAAMNVVLIPMITLTSTIGGARDALALEAQSGQA